MLWEQNDLKSGTVVHLGEPVECVLIKNCPA
jgi:hypothetical protein